MHVEIIKNTPSLANAGILVGDVFEAMESEAPNQSLVLLVRKLKGEMNVPYKKGTKWISKTMVKQVNEF